MRSIQKRNETADPANDVAKKRIELSQKEKRVLLFGVTAVLFVIALFAVLTETVGGYTLEKCEGIVYQTQRYDCIINLANRTRNVSLCSHVPKTYGYQCMARIAELERNFSLCNEINASSPVSIYCELNLSGSATSLDDCRSLANSSIRSSCIYRLASREKFADIAYCNYITNSILASNCGYIHYYNLALSTENSSYCLFLPDSTDVSPMALLSQNASGYNSTIASTLAFYELYNVTDRGVCYFGLARLMGNSTLCSQISGGLSNICESIVAGTNTTSNLNLSSAYSYCNQFTGYLQTYCTYGVLESVALRTNNITLCGQIGLQQVENLCITSLAKKYNHSAYCGYISNTTDASACYSSVSNTIK